MGFGKKLEDKMRAKGLKQADLVRATGISKTTLNSMIVRDNTKVDVEIFMKICNVLGCDPMDFADEVIKKPTTNGEMLTKDEKQLLDYFRGFNDEGQDKLLNEAYDMSQLDRYKTKAIYRAADSKEHTEHEIIEDGGDIIKKLSKASPVTKKEDF